MPAPKGNKNALGNKGGKGNPFKYKPEYANIAKKLYEMGATDYEVAEAFDVSTTTVKRWLIEHVEFALSSKASSETCTDRVEKSLFNRAVGYTFESEKVFNYQGEIVRAKTLEHVPPDMSAAQFWLKNRRKDNWRDDNRDKPPVLPEDALNAKLDALLTLFAIKAQSSTE